MITARQARLRFNDKDYVDAMVAVNQAILAASPNSRKTVIVIETGKNNTPVEVKLALNNVGFDVHINHMDNGFSEINVRW